MASEAKERTATVISVMVDNLQDAVAELVEQLKAAEQQLATERARHASMAAEFEKIAAGKHERYWTMEPGDVLLRPSGEVRKVRDGEWFRKGDDRYIRHDGYLTVSKFPIYRRIDAPAAAEPLPPPVSEQEGERFFVEPRNNWREVDVLERVGKTTFVIARFSETNGDPFIRASNYALYLNGKSSLHATIREQAAEIERLKLTVLTRDDAIRFLEKERDEIWAQLAKYKRDAEAWEAVRKQRIAVELSRVDNVTFVAVASGGRGYRASESPTDAVLALAASLSQQTGGKV